MESQKARFLLFHLARTRFVSQTPVSRIIDGNPVRKGASGMRGRKPNASSPENQAADSQKLGSLNFKVPVDFKKEFKGYAVHEGISMIDLLRKGFDLVKKQRAK
ncbi:hypothetical protein AJ87_09165 [Rhizobium yanglingense]|nr:hypothetical protein AJ87_09165 [Rhizobium yanglingense]